MCCRHRAQAVWVQRVREPHGRVKEKRKDVEDDRTRTPSRHKGARLNQEPNGNQHGAERLQRELEAAPCGKPTDGDLTDRQHEETDRRQPQSDVTNRRVLGFVNVLPHACGSYSWITNGLLRTT